MFLDVARLGILSTDNEGISAAAVQQNALQNASRLCSVETCNWSTKINVSEVWMEMSVCETSIRNSRTGVKGAVCFAMEHPLHAFNQGTKWQEEEEKPHLKSGEEEDWSHRMPR